MWKNPSHRHLCARDGRGCFRQKSKCPGSTRKPPIPFGAAVFPFKLPKVAKGRLKLNPVPPHFAGKRDRFYQFMLTLLGAKLGSKIDKNLSGGFPKSCNSFDWLWGVVLVPFGASLAPAWPPKPSQDRPKLLQKLIKNCLRF